MTNDDAHDLDITAIGAWRGKPLVAELFHSAGSARLPVIDQRLRSPGVLGDVRAWLEERRIRRTAMNVLNVLFRGGHSLLRARDMRVQVVVDDDGTSILMLPPSGRVVQIFSQELDGFTGYCAGYLGTSGWLWTDLTRLKGLADLSTGNDRFANTVMG